MSFSYHPDADYQASYFQPDTEQKPVTAGPMQQLRSKQDLDQKIPKDDYDPSNTSRPENPDEGMNSTVPSRDTQKPAGAFNIDRGHHVPLVASAIMDEQGNMSGMAMDHRIPPHPEYDQFIALHEASELPHMQNLIAGGMSNQDAYHEAHDKIATPIESAAVRAYAVSKGEDPDQYQDRYKQYWRDAAAVAREPTDKDRHPDAHTTRYGLDESEVGYKTAMNDHPPIQMDVLGTQLFGHGVTPGPGMFKSANENAVKPEDPRQASYKENTNYKYDPTLSKGANEALSKIQVKYGMSDSEFKYLLAVGKQQKAREQPTKSDATVLKFPSPGYKSATDQLRDYFNDK